MGKIINCIFILIIIMAFPAFAFADGNKDKGTSINLHSPSAVLVDALTGQVLYEKNSELKMYPASTTKILSAIIAIEKGNLNDLVTVSKRARDVEGTRVYLAEGEVMTLRQLLYGMLMNSGNDAAIAVAEHISGSVEQFADEMNRYATERLGLSRSHFVNPHGLYDSEHYTTAEDLAKIAMYAMKNPIFREIVGTKTLPWQGKEWITTVVNHNKMLWRYEGATGIKNGYTDQSRFSLVSSAKRNGTEFITVVLGANRSEDAYKDSIALLDYGFEHFKTVPYLRQGMIIPRFDFIGGSVIRYILNHDVDVTLTTDSDHQLSYRLAPDGNLSVWDNNERLVQVRLIRQQVTMFDTSTTEAGMKPAFAKYVPNMFWLTMFIGIFLFVALKIKCYTIKK